MKATYTSSNGRLQFAVEGATPKDLFGKLAGIQEVFDAENKCGLCQSDDLHYRVRTSTAKAGKNAGKTFTYYELVCMSCNARFSFGQINDDSGELYPKRREDGKPMPNGGWSKYDPNSAAYQEYEDHQRTQVPAATMPKLGATGELAGWLDRLDRDTGKFGAICGILLEKLTACGPTAVREYDRIAEAFGAKKRVELNDYKACVCDLHAALKRFEK